LKRTPNPKRKLKIRNHSSYLKVEDTLKIQNPPNAGGYYKISSLTSDALYLKNNFFLKLNLPMEDTSQKNIAF